MNWERVARHLKADAEGIRTRAQTGFPSDLTTQCEMRTRAALLVSLADALLAGLDIAAADPQP